MSSHGPWGRTGDVLLTKDGGANWDRWPFFLHQSGIDIDFSDPATGWLATDAGTVLRSVDGGRHWKVAKVFSLQVKALAAADADHAWRRLQRDVGAAGEPDRRLRLPDLATPARPGSARLRRCAARAT